MWNIWKTWNFSNVTKGYSLTLKVKVYMWILNLNEAIREFEWIGLNLMFRFEGSSKIYRDMQAYVWLQELWKAQPKNHVSYNVYFLQMKCWKSKLILNLHEY
jgi:hypothetical protein